MGMLYRCSLLYVYKWTHCIFKRHIFSSYFRVSWFFFHSFSNTWNYCPKCYYGSVSIYDPMTLYSTPITMLSLLIVPSSNGVFLLDFSTTVVSIALVYSYFPHGIILSPLLHCFLEMTNFEVIECTSDTLDMFVFLLSRHLALSRAHRKTLSLFCPTIRFGDAFSFAPVGRLCGVESGRKNVVFSVRTWPHHLNPLLMVFTARHRFRCPFGHLCTRVFMFDVCCLVVAAAAG